MSFFEIFLIGLGLSMDCFAVSVCYGAARKMLWKEAIKIGFFFALFQGAMPVIGWLIGKSLQVYIAMVDHWIAFAILSVIGIRMIIQSASAGEREKSMDIRKMSVLISLSIATSMDALVTGISFGVIRVNLLKAVVIIALVTFINSIAGIKIGEQTRIFSPRRAEVAGGVILIGIGIKIVLDHLVFL